VSPPARLEDWSLLDHLQLLLRSWFLILIPAIAGGISAYEIAATTTCSARVLIRIGAVSGVGMLETATDVAARLNSPSFAGAIARDNPAQFPKGSSLSLVATANGDLIDLASAAPTEAMAAQLLEASAARLAHEHEPAMTFFQSSARTRIADIERTVSTLQARLADTSKKSDDIGDRVLLDRIAALDREKSELLVRLEPTVSRLTQLVEKPTTYTTKGGKKQGLTGGFGGAALGAALAYLLDQLKRRRRESEEKPLRGSPTSQGADVRPIAKV
jgi:hypothetical protein